MWEFVQFEDCDEDTHYGVSVTQNTADQAEEIAKAYQEARIRIQDREVNPPVRYSSLLDPHHVEVLETWEPNYRQAFIDTYTYLAQVAPDLLKKINKKYPEVIKVIEEDI